MPIVRECNWAPLVAHFCARRDAVPPSGPVDSTAVFEEDSGLPALSCFAAAAASSTLRHSSRCRAARSLDAACASAAETALSRRDSSRRSALNAPSSSAAAASHSSAALWRCSACLRRDSASRKTLVLSSKLVSPAEPPAADLWLSQIFHHRLKLFVHFSVEWVQMQGQ